MALVHDGLSPLSKSGSAEPSEMAEKRKSGESKSPVVKERGNKVCISHRGANSERKLE